MYVIYGWDEAEFRCVPCLKAKRMAELNYQNHGQTFEFIPVSKYPQSEELRASRKELEARLAVIDEELKTLPQVFMQNGSSMDIWVGGFDDFKIHLNKQSKQHWVDMHSSNK